MATKRVTDLQVRRNQKLDEQKLIQEKVIAETRSKNSEETKRFYELANDILLIDDILRKYELEDANYRDTGISISTDENASFRNWINRSITGETKETYKVSMRADPIITTTDTGVLNKIVDNIDILYSPSEELLKNLGCKFYTNVNGNLILPRMLQDTATWPGEDVSAASADMSSTSLTLSALRVTHTQTITKETIAQTTDLVSSIIENLYIGIWNAVANKVFDDIDTDAATQIKPIKGSTLTFEDIVLQEASLGAYTLTKPAYCMAPETKAFCKKTASLTNQTAIWNNGVVNEYPAFATPSVNGEKIYFGDWSKVVVASFGDGIEVIIDPFTDARKGLIRFTAIGLFDVGVHNKSAFCIIADASTY